MSDETSVMFCVARLKAEYSLSVSSLVCCGRPHPNLSKTVLSQNLVAPGDGWEGGWVGFTVWREHRFDLPLGSVHMGCGEPCRRHHWNLLLAIGVSTQHANLLPRPVWTGPYAESPCLFAPVVAWDCVLVSVFNANLPYRLVWTFTIWILFNNHLRTAKKNWLETRGRPVSCSYLKTKPIT